MGYSGILITLFVFKYDDKNHKIVNNTLSFLSVVGLQRYS